VGWSQAQMDSALQKTDWWKTTSDTKRQWIEKTSNDPASAQQQVSDKAATINSQLVQQGVRLDPSRVQDIATQALEFGWNDVETKAALDSELMRSPSVLASQVGTNYKALADQYGVGMSDERVQQWAAHSISGVRSDEEFRQYLVTQAKGMFQNNADVQKFLDDGGTTDQYFDPYKQDAATVLGVNPDSIHLSDPKWSAAINAQHLDASGKPIGQIGSMTRQEWIQKLKSDPQYGYSSTTNGINDGAAIGATITSLFGGLPGAGTTTPATAGG
jgi:hypothetical protein